MDANHCFVCVYYICIDGSKRLLFFSFRFFFYVRWRHVAPSTMQRQRKRVQITRERENIGIAQIIKGSGTSCKYTIEVVSRCFLLFHLSLQHMQMMMSNI